jgi:hypothetical protein
LAYIEALMVSQCEQRPAVRREFPDGRPERFGFFIAVLLFAGFALALLRKLVIKLLLSSLPASPIGAFVIDYSKGPSRENRYVIELSYAFYNAMPGFLDNVPGSRLGTGHPVRVMPESLLPSADQLVKGGFVALPAFDDEQFVIYLAAALSHRSIIQVG